MYLVACAGAPRPPFHLHSSRLTPPRAPSSNAPTPCPPPTPHPRQRRRTPMAATTPSRTRACTASTSACVKLRSILRYVTR